MIKLLKYELRRSIGVVAVLLVLVLGIQGFTLSAIFRNDQAQMIVAMLLLSILVFGVALIIFITAVVSYSKELNSKYSFMSFMTPNSIYKIVGAKLLFIVITAIVITALGVGFILWDYNLAKEAFPDLFSATDVIKQIAALSISTGELASTGVLIEKILIPMILIWFNIFSVIAIAYLSITLSATQFSNIKHHGIISFIIFLVITQIVSLLTKYIPRFDMGSGMSGMLLSPILVYVVNIVIMIAAYIASSYILNKKINL